MKLCEPRLTLFLALFHSLALGQMVRTPAADMITIDARTPSDVPKPVSYRGGTATSASGHSIEVNSMYLTMDGRPWLPVMGEFHYSRVPESEWEEELLKMKSAGVQIVSTYVIWIHHEEIQGEFDWSGQRDLRRFAELCRRHGLYLVVRIGPWTHGEVRNGGLPDWVLKDGPTRRNAPAFMANVAAYYAQIGAQLKGLFWKDDGPVIGVQLENEYSARGPLEGEEYILALKKLAISDGLDVPLYTVTGWDNAVVPKGEVLPVFGGYPDAPWDSSIEALPLNEVYMFRFRSRVAGNMGGIGGVGESQAAKWDTPFFTAELGGGVQDTYHRRPVIEPDDVAAMVPVMLGSGANLYGYYMFQGGENPDGHLSTLQESQATGYPTDVPTKSYDFQAPLSEFGQERVSFRKLKVFHYFLNDFGSELARMSVHVPAATPKRADDLSVVRVSVRSNGQHGFLFVNNYLRGAAMPIRKNAVRSTIAGLEAESTGDANRYPLGRILHLAVQYAAW
jgi:beta-galactosidase